jgi:small subunit ribosomal protein S6
MTRPYEALVILRSGGTEQELARHAAQLEEQVKKLGGRVETSQAMGRRRLAFRISRQTEGHYHLLRFQAAPEQVAELERIFHLNEAIVRFMILNAEEAPLLTTLGVGGRLPARYERGEATLPAAPKGQMTGAAPAYPAAPARPERSEAGGNAAAGRQAGGNVAGRQAGSSPGAPSSTRTP